MRTDDFNKNFPTKKLLEEAVSKNVSEGTTPEEIEIIVSYLFSKSSEEKELARIIRLTRKVFPEHYQESNPILAFIEQVADGKKVVSHRKQNLLEFGINIIKWMCVDMVIYTS